MARFAQAENGSLLPIFAISLVPLMLAVGMSVDYSSAVSSKATMQSALDAATLSLTTLPKSTSEADRTKQLQDVFQANAGQGTAAVLTPVYDADGTLHLSASATYSMPTNFMKIATISNVDINVQTKVVKKPSLIEATFKIDKVSGWWNKTVTLYGTKFNETAVNKLLEISYSHNRFGDPKGYGTTTVNKITKNAANNDVATQVQKQTCTTKSVSNFNNATATDIKETSGNSKWLISCVTDPANGGGAVIDVSEMATLYLEMKIPNPNAGLGGGSLARGTKETLRSDDKNTSDRLFIDGLKTKANTIVDIFSAVPCSVTSSQAWEDGGSLTNNTIDDADFFYKVTGVCNYNQRIAQTRIVE